MKSAFLSVFLVCVYLCECLCVCVCLCTYFVFKIIVLHWKNKAFAKLAIFVRKDKKIVKSNYTNAVELGFSYHSMISVC